MNTIRVTFEIPLPVDPEKTKEAEQKVLDAVNTTPLRQMATDWTISNGRPGPRISFNRGSYFSTPVQDD